VVEEHQTPLVMTEGGLSREFFQRAGGRLASLGMVGERMMLNLAAEFDGNGLLDGRTIGIVSSDLPNFVKPVEGVFVPELRRRGHKVADVARLSTWPGSQGQIPLAVQRMRAAGVDAVINVEAFPNFTQFVQTAEGQGWRPRYFTAEYVGMTSDFEVQAMPESFDGAVAMTSKSSADWRDNVPEPAHDVACRETYERATGESIPRNNGDASNSEYSVTLQLCGITKVFTAAAQAAGPNLTRGSYVEAMQRLGPMEAAFYFGGAFGAGKTDLSDHVRLSRYVHSCRCWRNLDQIRPAQFR
jgi:ABC-type branched-subunit amino acid transport system substrate-binding protein